MPRLSADARHTVRFELNGRAVVAEAEPRMLLTDFLRQQLAMTGTHVGCEHGVCGACTVEIDGVPARACLTLAVQADVAGVRTVEGLAPEPGRLSILQEAFRRHHALQCGFCTAGILMSLDFFSPSSRPQRGRVARLSRRAFCAAAPVTFQFSLRHWTPPNGCGTRMLDLGTSFLASVERDPRALAIADGELRLDYASWYRRISAVAASLTELGLKPDDHLLTILQTAGRRPLCTGPANSSASSSPRSTGGRAPPSSIS